MKSSPIEQRTVDRAQRPGMLAKAARMTSRSTFISRSRTFVRRQGSRPAQPTPQIEAPAVTPGESKRDAWGRPLRGTSCVCRPRSAVQLRPGGRPQTARCGGDGSVRTRTVEMRSWCLSWCWSAVCWAVDGRCFMLRGPGGVGRCAVTEMSTEVAMCVLWVRARTMSFPRTSIHNRRPADTPVIPEEPKLFGIQ